MKRIAVFLPNWIGDVVMATPAIRALAVANPCAEIIAVCKPYVAETLAGAPWFQGTIFYDQRGSPERRFWRIVQQFREKQFDTAILFPNSLRSALVAKLGGCKRIIGYARYARDFFLTDRLYHERDSYGKFRPVPIINDYNRIVQKLRVPDPGHRMELFTTEADEAAANAVWKQFGLNQFTTIIGLNSGGAFGASKNWPTPYFVELAQKLAAKPGTAVLALCGPNERETARDIARLANHTAVLSLADIPLSLGLTKAIVRRLSLLVTTDSGPRHFAAAFNRPVVTLFGPTHIGWTETYFGKAIHLQKPVPCGPCQLRVCPLDHRCMNELKPTEVMAAIYQLLK